LTGSITLTGVDDGLVEDDETVVVDIASVVNAQESGQQQIEAVIEDDDTLPVVTVTVRDLADGDAYIRENGGVAVVRVQLSHQYTLDTVVQLRLTGTATNGIDYQIGDGYQLVEFEGVATPDPEAEPPFVEFELRRSTTNLRRAETVVFTIVGVSNGIVEFGDRKTLVHRRRRGLRIFPPSPV
jgi:hypothetical protein